jgi:ABC-type arginine transport system permease subunit
MLYLKTIDKEKDLSTNRANLRNTQWQLILYKSTIGSLVKFDTELLGNIKSTAIESKKGKSPISTIIVAGVAGLIMSLCIAFLMEYIEESKSRRKGK